MSDIQKDDPLIEALSEDKQAKAAVITDPPTPKHKRRTLVGIICAVIVLVIIGIICAYVFTPAPIPAVIEQGSGNQSTKDMAAQEIGEVVTDVDVVTDTGTNLGSPTGGGGTSPTNSGTGGTATASGRWVTIVDSPAWDEQVLLESAWTDYPQVPVIISRYDGRIFYSGAEFDAVTDPWDYGTYGYYTSYVPGSPVYHDAVYQTVHHPAVTHQEWVVD